MSYSDPVAKIIVAADVSTLDALMQLVEELAPHVGYFKIGLELISSVGGPQAVRAVHESGGRVFYDGKFCDIPNTVAAATKEVVGLGVAVAMLNVHASCGIEAMAAAVENRKGSFVFVLAVTVLTSLDENNAHLILGAPSKAKVLQFARDAKIAGCDGVICSPQELELLGMHRELDGMLRVTPGVRPEWASTDDQKRVMTPGEAIAAGATYLVIGRPITGHKVPVEAANLIADEIEKALSARESI